MPSPGNNSTVRRLEEQVLSGREITRDEACLIASVSGTQTADLFASANRIRDRFRGETIDLCSIINAKSGGCPEDCAYCAQSVRSSSEISRFPLLDRDRMLEAALKAKEAGTKRFCIVTGGRKPTDKELAVIAETVSAVRAAGLLPCATLGLLQENELAALKRAGLERYHNNLETSERFFPEICTTHTYQDKQRTISAAQAAGLSVCSGGIFGLGEDWADRIDMAFALKELSPDSVPINFLTPVRGTRLQSRPPLPPLEALKIVSLYRFILPAKEIRVCGGRMQTLGDLHPLIFFAGADGLLTGDYLTTLGRSFADDLRMISEFGLRTA
ncbi:MAG: biotin synthase BioB [Nitrospirae bacterium]|nr:MAG: biotin synthase BioB [Nitrospirota bacterium]